jgi:hypothetical protein
MKKIIISLFCVMPYQSMHVMHAMELERALTLPTADEITHAHNDLKEGLARYNPEQFTRGYQTHKQACAYYFSTLTDPAILPPQLKRLCRFESRLISDLLSKKYWAESPAYTSESYQARQCLKQSWGLGLLCMGSILTASSGFEALKNDDGAPWWSSIVSLKTSAGVLALYYGTQLAWRSTHNSQHAAAIIATRKEAIGRMYRCIFPNPEQAG